MINSFCDDLKIAKQLVYDSCGFELTNLKSNSESKEYQACSFELNGMKIQHRASKITPTKSGQFVTIWKRNSNGITEPYDLSDDVDFIIISARKGDNFGQFIFSKSLLADKGIVTQISKAGKRGIRVYPPWDVTTSKQAEKTQSWQTKYFLIINESYLTDVNLAKELFSNKTGFQSSEKH